MHNSEIYEILPKHETHMSRTIRPSTYQAFTLLVMAGREWYDQAQIPDKLVFTLDHYKV